MALAIDLSRMDYRELTALIENAQSLQKAQRTEMYGAYGKGFVKQIGQGSAPLGISILSKIPIVKPGDIGFTDDPEDLVTPASMGNLSVARGALHGRHFVAIKLKVSSPPPMDETEEKGTLGAFVEIQRVWDVVEVIFQEAEDNKGCYTTHPNCSMDTGHTIPSALCKGGTMTHEQIRAVGQLLSGLEIEAPASPDDKRLVKIV